MKSDMETRRQAAWDKVPAGLIDELERCRMVSSEVSKPYERIQDQINGLVSANKLDHLDANQKAMFLTMDELFEPFKKSMAAHLDALKACWDSVGGEPT